MDPSFLFSQFMGGLTAAMFLFLIASGLSLVFGVMRVLNFAHGALLMLGAYVCHFIFTRVLGSYALATLGAIVVLLPIGWLLERTVFAPLRDNLRNVSPLRMVTGIHQHLGLRA